MQCAFCCVQCKLCSVCFVVCSVNCAGVGVRSAGAPGYWAGSRLGSPTAHWSDGSEIKKKMNTRLMMTGI